MGDSRVFVPHFPVIGTLSSAVATNVSDKLRERLFRKTIPSPPSETAITPHTADPPSTSGNRKSVHLLERIEGISAELDRPDTTLPSGFVLSLSIFALHHQNDVLKQKLGGKDVKTSVIVVGS